MPKSTYDLIESFTITSNTPSISINIPQTYSHLEIITGLIGTGTLQNNIIRFNSDANSNYGNIRLVASGQLPSPYTAAGNTSSQTYIPLDNYGNSWNGGIIIHVIKIYDYKNTSYFKQCSIHSSELGGSTNGIDIISGTWRSTSPITNINIAPLGAAFGAGSTLSIYGIMEE